MPSLILINVQAANAFKVEKRWSESGAAFERSAGRFSRADRKLTDFREAACRQHANELNDAMNAFHNAAKSYKKSEPEGQLIDSNQVHHKLMPYQLP